MSDAIIQALKHRIPSELRSQACLCESSTRMGDILGSPRVASLFFVSRDDSVIYSSYLIFVHSDSARLSVMANWRCDGKLKKMKQENEVGGASIRKNEGQTCRMRSYQH